MAITNALILGVADQLESKAVDALKELGDIRERFYYSQLSDLSKKVWKSHAISMLSAPYFYPTVCSELMLRRNRSGKPFGTYGRRGCEYLSILFCPLLPTRFALELNRPKGKIDQSATYEGVLDFCREIGDSLVGICWDWSYAQANVVNGESSPDPPEEFLRRVILHTHP
jgi:hypothetical protein